MKNIFVAVFFSFFSIAGAQTTINGSFWSGGYLRTYILYIPAIYNPSNPSPVVFNFHGYGSNSTQQEYYGDFRAIADTANFLLVMPQGLTLTGTTGWNNFGTISSANIDLNFISALIDTLNAQYNINQNRIYSTGMSNGGFMSYDLACFLSNRFAAIASVTGSMISNHLNSCNCSHPMPVMEIHGTTDPTVSYTGVGGIVSCTHIDSLVKHWAVFNNCNLTPVVTSVPNINLSDSCTAEHYLFTGGDAGSTVELFKIIGGGHTWPGSVYPVSGQNTNQDFNASKEIWRFFCRYNYSTGINNMNNNNDISVFPNPASDKIFVNIKGLQSAEILLYNLLGEQVLVEKCTDNNNAYNVSGLSNGIYSYLIKKGENTLKTGRIVVQ